MGGDGKEKSGLKVKFRSIYRAQENVRFGSQIRGGY